jgi:hypothetical protein
MSGWSARDFALLGAADRYCTPSFAPNRRGLPRQYGRYGSSYVTAMTSDSVAETTLQLEPVG